MGRAEVGRGHCVLHPSLHAPSRRLDVLVRLLDGNGGLAHWSAAHLHLGTADVMARVAVRRGAKIPAGGEAWAQLVLEQPVSALYGDRFILRDPSARQTLGGGVVLDPWPPARRPQAAVRATQLAALAHTDPVRALEGLALCSPNGVDVAEFIRARNLAQADVADMLRRAKLVSVGPVAVVQERLQAWIHTLEAEVDLQHQTQPQASGAELVALRKTLSGSATGPVFDALLAMLTADGRVEVTSGYARRPGHASTGNSVDRQMWRIARARIEAAGHRGISVAKLACEAGLNERQLRDLLRRLVTSGELVRVTQDRYYLRATMAGFAATAKDLAQASPTGRFSVADYRDRTGLGRALVIDVLETLDRLAITRRLGDARLVWKDYVPLLGPDWPAPSG